MGRRKERIAHNEARFRAVNETLGAELRAAGASATEVAGFLCECGDLTCAARVRLPLGAYERIRAHPRRFLLRPGHEIADVEEVVDRGGRFVVVEKVADAGTVAARTDPRSTS
jgi:hypothetical protein